jgi:N-acetylglutamate synthase-like GNAT family acetyltransferase
LNYAIRDYTQTDEPSWVRCRVLSFLSTAYYDDVARAKPAIASPGFELVAIDENGTILGIMDIAVEGGLATIDTVAVHPDHQHRGIGRSLLARALARVRTLTEVAELHAWTRDDADTLRWYQAMGFTESEHYLHVYANHYTAPEEPIRAVGSPRPGLRLKMAFLHANLAEEEQMRREFSRVHICRRFTMTL